MKQHPQTALLVWMAAAVSRIAVDVEWQRADGLSKKLDACEDCRDLQGRVRRDRLRLLDDGRDR